MAFHSFQKKRSNSQSKCCLWNLTGAQRCPWCHHPIVKANASYTHSKKNMCLLLLRNRARTFLQNQNEFPSNLTGVGRAKICRVACDAWLLQGAEHSCGRPRFVLFCQIGWSEIMKKNRHTFMLMSVTGISCKTWQRAHSGWLWDRKCILMSQCVRKEKNGVICIQRWERRPEEKNERLGRPP